MDQKILNEFIIPLNNNQNIIIRVVQEELMNVLLLIQEDQTIRLPLIGYTPNFLAEMINLNAMNYSSLHNLNPQFQPFVPNIQPPRSQPAYAPRKTFGSKNSAPVQFSKEITTAEAIAIVQKKVSPPTETVKVRSTPEEMVDFIIAYKGGQEIYVKGELRVFKGLNLFIDLKLFTETLARLVRDKVVGERHKTSATGNPYTVYVIPKTIGPKEEEKKIVEKTPELIPASEVQSTVTEYLETLFYSLQDEDLTMDFFISEASYEKIPPEIARAFYEKKLAEREAKILKKSIKGVGI
jgi:hypothetical protein